jgi:hypothetical protein
MCHSKWVGSNHTFQSADKLYSTAVLAGLMRIADDPGILSVNVVPVSLWLRSDPDETTGEDDGNTVVRICTQGQDTNDTVSVRDRISASHPVHYELCAADDKPPSLDLSVFGTPAGVSDEDIIEGWNVENFAYTDVGKVTEFGRFEQELPDSTITLSRRVCHVYLYVKVSRLSVELYAIFANDERAVKPLEKTPFDKAFQNGEITTKWKKYQGVRLRIVRLNKLRDRKHYPRIHDSLQHQEASNLKLPRTTTLPQTVAQYSLTSFKSVKGAGRGHRRCRKAAKRNNENCRDYQLQKEDRILMRMN